MKNEGKKLLGFYDYTVLLTYAGAMFAAAGIFMALRGDFRGAAVCLMLAGVCDMFDGAVAATRERTAPERRFGIQIDSLSDLVSFGVLPGLFVYCLMEQGAGAGLAAMFYLLCALIRLAYFNVLEEERQRETEECRKSFLGVPVTTVAILLPAVWLLYDRGLLPVREAFAALLVGLAAGFLVPVKIPKPRGAGKLGILLLGALELAGLLLSRGR